MATVTTSRIVNASYDQVDERKAHDHGHDQEMQGTAFPLMYGGLVRAAVAKVLARYYQVGR